MPIAARPGQGKKHIKKSAYGPKKADIGAFCGLDSWFYRCAIRFGLADLKFVTAAASTNVAIPGLPEGDAAELRDRLVELAESRRAGL